MKHLSSFWLSLLCAIAIVIPTNAANGFLDNSVNDIVLMYYGQNLRKKWNVNQVSHFVTHTYKDGHTDWLFPAFLYLEFSIKDKDITLAPGYAKNAATKNDWEWLIDRYFAKNQGLDALNTAIQNAKSKLGEPPFRHKVILGIPTPIKNQTNWGRTSRKLNFKKANDRLEALYWFIDQLVIRFNEANYRNIELEGLYWVDEDMHAGGELFPALSNKIHQYGLNFYWIPYFGAYGRDTWKQYGFDYAYLQPNYFFNKDVPKSRLQEACSVAKRNGLALELEFDEQHFTKKDIFGKRLKEYLDVYEKNGVFEDCPLTYYCGNHAFLQLSQSREPQDIQLIDRMASLIANRNAKMGAQTTVNASQSTYPGGETNKPSETKQQDQKQEESTTRPSLMQQLLNLLNPEYWHF